MELCVKLKWTHDNKVCFVFFECVEVISSMEDDLLRFFCFDTGEGIKNSSIDFDTAFKEYPLAHGTIKWDGCMDINDYSHHYCGYDDFHDRLIKTIYAGAMIIMADTYDGTEEWFSDYRDDIYMIKK